MDNVRAVALSAYTGLMTAKTRPPKKRPDPEALGYMNVRISKKAHKELLRRAIAERRTIIRQLEVILGV